MGSLTVGGWVTGHSSIMINNMDLVFSQPRGGVNTMGSKKTVRTCTRASSQGNTWGRMNIHKWLDHYTKCKYIYSSERLEQVTTGIHMSMQYTCLFDM